MKDFKWYEWAMLVFLILFGIVGALMSPWGQAFIASDAAPAWIQAVGSVGAIGVAIMLGKHQRDHDLHLAKNERVARLHAVLAIGIQGSKALKTTDGRLERYAQIGPARVRAYAARRTGGMQLVLSQLEVIDFSQFPYALVVREGLNLRNRLRLAIEVLEALRTSPEGDAEAAQNDIAKFSDQYRAYRRWLRQFRLKVTQYDGSIAGKIGHG